MFLFHLFWNNNNTVNYLAPADKVKNDRYHTKEEIEYCWRKSESLHDERKGCAYKGATMETCQALESNKRFLEVELVEEYVSYPAVGNEK